jgi:hypothetical protein
MSGCSPTDTSPNSSVPRTERQKRLKWFQIEMISIFIPVPLEMLTRVLAL